MRLLEKVALITGAASGIGKETALLFAKEGAKVVLTDIHQENGLKAVEWIHSAGGHATFIKHDVSMEDEWKSVIQTVLQTYERLDVVVNSAGIGKFAAIEDTTFELWHQILSVNLDGPFFRYQIWYRSDETDGRRIHH